MDSIANLIEVIVVINESNIALTFPTYMIN